MNGIMTEPLTTRSKRRKRNESDKKHKSSVSNWRDPPQIKADPISEPMADRGIDPDLLNDNEVEINGLIETSYEGNMAGGN